MTTKSNGSIGMLILQIALALFLITYGIAGIQGGNSLLGSIRGNSTITMIFGVCALVAGILIALNLFNITAFSSFVDIVLLVIIGVWVINIIINDVATIGSAFKSGSAFLKWLKDLAPDLLALAGLLLVKGI